MLSVFGSLIWTGLVTEQPHVFNEKRPQSYETYESVMFVVPENNYLLSEHFFCHQAHGLEHKAACCFGCASHLLAR